VPFERAELWRCGVPLALICWALPRAALPGGVSFFVAFAVWVLVSSSLAAPWRWARLLELGAGAALAGLAGLEPLVWLELGAALLALKLLGRELFENRRLGLTAVVGVLLPAAFYGVLCALGPDQRTALALAFRSTRSAFDLGGIGLTLMILVTSTLTLSSMRVEGREVSSRAVPYILVAGIVLVLAARVIFIASVATLRTDLTIWSESPALTNLLKLHNGDKFYGPLAEVNSYSYSPGLELTQYALLRPFHGELSLRAHRALGSLWQLASAFVLTRALWPWLREQLELPLGKVAFPTLFCGLACLSMASLLAPHVHPDHWLLLVFSGALALCVRREPFTRKDDWWLVCLPVFATVFKLTGAGIGFGLVLAAVFERRFRALLPLALGGALALLTIPLFNATLGNFSAYAIVLQASHPIEWFRWRDLPHSPAALMLAVTSIALVLGAIERRTDPRVRAATRVLLLTVGFGLTAIIAYLKRGGREHNLMPFLVGGAVAFLVLVSHDKGSEAPVRRRSALSSEPPLIALLWLALTVAWPKSPVMGDARASLVALHEREVRFVRELSASGKKPLTQGMAAWIESGRRDVPRDRLSSATELDLGHSPALAACEARLANGAYDGLFVSASALSQNEFLLRLRPALERQYRISEEQFAGGWATGRDGFVILSRRESEASR